MIEKDYAEIKKSLSILQKNPLWKTRYQTFVDTMVYDKSTALDYESAMIELEKMSSTIVSAL